MKTKPLLFRLLAVTLGCLGALVAATAALLLSLGGGPQWDAPLMIQQMDCSHGICRDRPGSQRSVRDAAGGHFTVTANSEGFRGADPPAPGSGLVVEIFGDSMIHGTGVEDDHTIARRLELALRRRLGTEAVYAINYGMPMNYLVSSLATYERWGRTHAPDVVVLTYHGGIPSPRDVNSLVQQIRGSWLMSSTFETWAGRTLINRVQSASLRHYSEREAIAALQPGFARLAADQRERGTAVVFFSFGDRYDQLARIVPRGLEYTTVTTGIGGWEGYRSSRYIIPGDGHPNALGTEFYGSAIAATLEPILRARLAARAGR
ncbi:MAG: hypothetical protein R3A48_10435 [Polyangiales bacterium]